MRALRSFLLTKAFVIASFAFPGNCKIGVEPGINTALLMTILLLSCLPEQLLANSRAMPLRHGDVGSYIWHPPLAESVFEAWRRGCDCWAARCRSARGPCRAPQ